jgi:hypothetical protein
VVHDGDPLAELVGLLHVVGGEQDGLAVAVQLAEQVPQREPALRVEPAVGSSRNSTEGRWKMARATISRCAIPPDSAYTDAFAHLDSWNCSSSSSAICRDAFGPMPNSRPWK